MAEKYSEKAEICDENLEGYGQTRMRLDQIPNPDY